MLKVGITGGIGSGKTTVCKMFELLNVPVYFSDIRSKELIQSDQDLIEAIKSEFGNQIYDRQNSLDRVALAAIVFKDEQKLKKLNSIVHPAVAMDFMKWCANFSNEKYVIKESALLFETEAGIDLDFIITVYADPETRLKRIQDRDKSDASDVLLRMKNQLPDTNKMSRSDYVIFNDGKQSLIKQVLALHNELSNDLI
ncbi:dephospho-CoA kinase [Bacteroidota bacterium]